MNPLAPDLEPRLSTLQTEMERLRHATGVSSTTSIEDRLARLTEECAEIVRRWGATSDRHAHAVERFESHLNEWAEAGARLQQDATHRIHELERIIHQEWGELKHLHEEPIRQLAEHATSLTQVCIATANVAQQGFERSEARLAAIEGELNHRLTDLTRELQSVVVELRAARPQPRLGQGSTPWPLEGVTRLHDQLRQTEGVPTLSAPLSAVPAPASLATTAPAGLLPEAAQALTERVATLERALAERESATPAAVVAPDRDLRLWRGAAAVMGLVGVLALAFVWQLNGEVDQAATRLEQAQRDQQAAADHAAQQVTAARADAEREVADARARADNAQIIGSVLAAPDTVRYNLYGRATLAGASAQVHWSHSRGLVFSGSAIPPPPSGQVYQVWLLVRGGATKAGTFSPDAAGTATLAAPPPALRNPAFGAIVTLEPASGSDTPSGSALLARATVPAPAPE